MKKYIIISLLFFSYYANSSTNIVSKTVSPISEMEISSISDKDGHIRFYQTDGDKLLFEIKSINDIVDQGGEICTPYISYDGRKLFFSLKNNSNDDFDIYYSEYINNQWSSPQIYSEILNSEYDDICPIISAYSNDIFFIRRNNVLQRNNMNKIETHIYSSTKIDNALWSKPYCLIISKDGDMSPIILPDDETFIFASNREIEGKTTRTSQIYYTKKLRNYNWLDPIIVTDISSGPKFNPFYSYIDKKLFYFDNKGICDNLDQNKIRKTYVANVVGNVYNSLSNNGIKAKIVISDALTNQPIHKIESYNDGFFAFPLNKGKEYIIDIYADGYTHHFLKYDASNLDQDTSITINAKLSTSLDLTFNIFDKLIYSKIKGDVVIEDFHNNIYRNIKIDSLDFYSKRAVLPLGKDYRIFIKSPGYEDLAISLQKERIVQFNKSSLDIDLNPILLSINIKTIDIDTKKHIPSSIELYNDNLEEFDNIILDTIYSNIKLRKNAKYELTTTSKGYIFNVSNLDMSRYNENDTCIIELTPIKSGKVVNLENVNFAYNSSEILEKSIKNINNVLNLLRSNPNLHIKIAAHTDDIGGNSYNFKLSNKRAKAVVDYLIDNGIAPSRLEAVGYGMTKPLVSNSSEENRAKNRRVEFIIL